MADTALVLVSEALQHLGLNPNLESELTGTITSAAITAMFKLETEIDSRLRPHAVEELFLCNLEPFNGITPNGMIHLRTSNFYLAADPVPVVTYSETLKGTYSTMPEDHYLLDRERGLLMVDAVTYEDLYVKISYQCGFADVDDVPEIIKHGLLAYLPSTFKNQEVSEGGEGSYKDGDAFAKHILVRLRRQMSICLRPMFSTATAL